MKINIKSSKTLKFIFHYKILKIFLLGSISGFPWVLIGSSLSLWLKDEDLSRSMIGWAGLIFSVYAFNYLWAPLVDKISIPFLGKLIGHRKSWIFLMQSIIIICLLIWGFVNPKDNLNIVIAIGLIIAISSSTQDITIDALRIEQFDANEKSLISAAATVAVIGWWSGFKIGGLFSLFLSEFFEKNGYVNFWQLSFFSLIFILILFNFLLLFINENNKKLSKSTKNEKIVIKNFSFIYTSISWLYKTFFMPITAFFKKNGFYISIAILFFVFSFKIGEAFLGRMSLIFTKN